MRASTLRQAAERQDLETAVEPPRVNLALQGGGSHGAFTWGVLDRLLEEVEAGRLQIGHVSGTSAGAMNATVLIHGLESGGPAQARTLLDKFWSGVTAKNLMSEAQELWTGLTGDPNLDRSFGFKALEFWQSSLSPYQFNPANVNPLRDLLTETVDFDALATRGADRLFIGATNVTRGDLKTFSGAEISADAVMASAALPRLFKAVEIDGEAYWDGGYMGNPPMEPLFYNNPTDDTLLVQINPFGSDKTPTSRGDISNTENRLMFNAALMGELRDIAKRNAEFEAGLLKPSPYLMPQRLHRIADETGLGQFNETSKSNTAGSFLKKLKAMGRAAADEWLTEHAPSLGKESTWQFDGSDPLPLRSALKTTTAAPSERRQRLQAAAVSLSSASDLQPVDASPTPARPLTQGSARPVARPVYAP